jgi:hypothetical protein
MLSTAGIPRVFEETVEDTPIFYCPPVVKPPLPGACFRAQFSGPVAGRGMGGAGCWCGSRRSCGIRPTWFRRTCSDGPDSVGHRRSLPADPAPAGLTRTPALPSGRPHARRTHSGTRAPSPPPRARQVRPDPDNPFQPTSRPQGFTRTQPLPSGRSHAPPGSLGTATPSQATPRQPGSPGQARPLAADPHPLLPPPRARRIRPGTLAPADPASARAARTPASPSRSPRPPDPPGHAHSRGRPAPAESTRTRALPRPTRHPPTSPRHARTLPADHRDQ